MAPVYVRAAGCGIGKDVWMGTVIAVSHRFS